VEPQEEWPPPPHAILAGVFFIFSINAIAQHAWAIAALTLALAVLAAFHDHHAQVPR
jgi:hypothetical protein